MRYFGFKLFSTNLYNAPDLVQECADFARSQEDMFIELMVVSSSTSEDFQKLKNILSGLEVRIHAAHLGENLNVADKSLEQHNLALIGKAQQAADVFNSSTIIVHAGYGEDDKALDEISRQFKLFNDKRVIVENQQCFTSKGIRCQGDTAKAIKYIMDASGCRFCMDFSHAICAAVHLKIDVEKQLQSFFDLKPAVYHICDGNLKSSHDMHEHLGNGNYPLAHFLNDYTDENAYITMETGHGVLEHNDLWVKDYQYLKSLLK